MPIYKRAFSEDTKIESVSNIASNEEILGHFRKVIAELREEQTKQAGTQLVPVKLDEFLYGHCIMMHSAEAALIDHDTGEFRKNARGEPVRGWFEEINDSEGRLSTKWVSPDGVQAYKNCFVNDTQILLKDGTTKSISDIKIGDSVISHLGNICEVENVITNDPAFGIYEISTRNGPKTYATGEHPFYVAYNNKNGNKPSEFFNSKNEFTGMFTWAEARSLDSKKHKLLTPRLKHKYGNLSTAECRLLGIFAAEGYYSKKYNKRQGARFTFNILEFETLATDTIELSKIVLPNSSAKIYKYPNRGVCEVTITGKGVADWFYAHVGEYSQSKKLSNEVVYASDEAKLAFIGGWIDGDGCREKHYGQIIGVSTSKDLISQIQTMLNSLGVANSVRFKTNLKDRIINTNYPAYAANDIYRIEISNSYSYLIKKTAKFLNTVEHPTRQYYRVTDDYILSSIYSTKLTDRNETVYNLKVSGDNSYIANGYAVHNCNGDIFPEEDLVLAHKDWRGKPLCKDHMSNTVDGVRGIIIDTFYDPKFKRVHALFALDRKNYGELARKIEAGYATNVSMGTAVGRSICTECGNVATVEPEYCHHIRSKANYGEINKDLSPIELSLVVTGADPRAKVRTVLAEMQGYSHKKTGAEQVTVGDFLANATVEQLKNIDADTLMRQAGTLKDSNKETYGKIMDALLSKYEQEGVDLTTHGKLASLIDDSDVSLRARVNNMPMKLEQEDGAPGTKSPAPIADWAKTQGVGNTVRPPVEEIGHSGLEIAQEVRNTEGFTPNGGPVMNFSFIERKNVIKESNLNSQTELHNKEMQMPMNFEDLKKRAERRLQAYYQGTEDPKATPYAPMGKTHDEMRKLDRHMDTSNELDIKPDDLPGEDKKKKELLQRASIVERRKLRASYLTQIKEAAGAPMETLKNKQNQSVAVRNTQTGEVSSLQAKDAAKKDKDCDEDDKKSDKGSFADRMKALREKKKTEKKAYYQGTEEPTTYPLMGNQDALRNTQDKQMLQTGNMGGDAGLVPGDEEKKRGLQRAAAMKGQLIKGAAPADAVWKFVNKSTGKELLSVKASAAYEDELNVAVEGTSKLNNNKRDLTGAEFFQTSAYAREVMKRIRTAGLVATADELGGELPPSAPEQAPGAPGLDDAGSDGMQDKLAEALSKIESAVEEIRQAVGSEGLKDVEVPEVGSEGETPALQPAAAAKNQLLVVYAHMTGLAKELNFLGTKLDKDLGFVSEAASAVGDASNLVNHYNEILTGYSETVVAPKKKAASKLLSELLEVRAERRKNLLSEAMGEMFMAEAPEEEVPMEYEEDESDIDEALARLSEGEQGEDEMAAFYADDKKEDDKDDKEDKEDEEDEQDALFNSDGEFLAKDKKKDDEDDNKEDDDKDDKEDEQDALFNSDGEFLAKDKKEDEDKKEDDDKDDKEDEQDALFNSDGEFLAKDKDKDEDDKEDEDKDDKEDEQDSLDSIASRRAWRESLLEKIAAAGTDDFQGIPLNEEYAKTRSDAGTKTSLDTSVANNNDMVENLHEQHRAHLDVARSEPRNVRMAAAALDGAIKTGALKASDLNTLVAEGKVDGETASFWKTYYGQVDGGGEFASGLVAEFDKGKTSKASVDAGEKQEVRLKRAYALALDAQDRFLIPSGRATLHGYVDNLIKLDDVAFESMKNIVAQTKASGQKVANASPRSGINYDDMDTASNHPSNEMLGEPNSNATPQFKDLATIFFR